MYPYSSKWFVSFSMVFILIALNGFSEGKANQLKTSKDLTATVEKDSTAHPKRIYNTMRITEAPEIDGKLNDSCWKLGEWQTDYEQFSPVYRGKATHKTEIKILYDDKNIYAAIRAYDDMSKITRRLDRRDNFSGDLVGLHFDSYHDRRTAFEFDLTAAGQKIDVWVGNDGWDVNWNAVWHGKVAYEDSCWTAEYRIPLSQLRYGPAKEQVWGLDSWRLVDRIQEENQWNVVANDGTGLVYTFGELHGLKDLKKVRRIEVAPYTSARLTTSKKIAGNPFATGSDFLGQGGIDAKIGLTNNFTLDATINPDFGQVEADPSVMNLTAFETYFEEKRPFFVEGKNIFDFTFDKDQLFYTRRIGHAPSYTPNYETYSVPENTTIAGAFKLSGKTANGLSVGVIESVTAKEIADIHDGNRDFSQTAEPLSNYFIGRFQKDFDKGNTIIGGILTHTYRSIKDDYLNFLSRNALTYGVDFTRYWNNRRYFFEAKAIGSSINGDKEAILRLQNSSARYFQRPDAPWLSYDPVKTDLNGFGASVKTGKWSKGHWRYSEEINMRSPGLELNDLGYMTISNITKNNTSVSYVEKKNTKTFKTYQIDFLQQNAWNSHGNGLFSMASLAAQTELMNAWMLQLSGQYKWRTVDEWILRGGPAMKLPDQFSMIYSLTTSHSKKLYAGINGNYARNTNGNSYNYSLGSEISFRPRSNLRFSVLPFFLKNRDELQYIGQVSGSNNQNTYLLGAIDNRNLSFTFRMDLALTPELTIQYYGCPFVSIGKFTDFKKVTNPKDDNYTSRFSMLNPVKDGGQINFDENKDGRVDYSVSNPDFNFHQFRSNLVLRWEYKVGSALYLVWAQDRTGYEQGGPFSFSDGFNQMTDIFPRNTFMVKFSYWFSL